MTRGAHWNRNARRSGGDRKFTLPLPSVGIEYAVLSMHIAAVRDELGQDGVERFIKMLRERGDLQCTDEQAQEFAK